MKRMIALLAVLGCAAALVRFWTADPAQRKCMDDARRFISDVEDHRRTYPDAGMFATDLGQQPTSELFDRDQELIGCMETDPAHKDFYYEALDRNDSVESARFLKFLLNTGQMKEFGAWEHQQQVARDMEARLK